jgi:hypothetical protein
MMSGVRAVRGSADTHLPPESHPAPKRDEDDQSPPRKRKPPDAKTPEHAAHQLDVEA